MTGHELASATPEHAGRMGVTLVDLASLLDNNHRLSAWCPACRRWANLDLARLVAQGYGRRRLVGFKPRCRACGQPGQIQVRPPAPTWGGASWGPIR